MARRRDQDGPDFSKQDNGPMSGGQGLFSPQQPQAPVAPMAPPDRSNPDPRGPDETGGIDPTGQSGESPRERQQIQQLGQQAGGGASGGMPITSTPRQPSTPSPAMGSTMQAGPPNAGPPDVGTMQGLQPFQPMGGPTPVDMASPRLRSLYGGANGQKQGGLGVPGAPNAATNDITSLIMQLLGQAGG